MTKRWTSKEEGDAILLRDDWTLHDFDHACILPSMSISSR